MANDIAHTPGPWKIAPVQVAALQREIDLRVSHAELLEALKGLLPLIETCDHTSTHRGGFIWTICDDCGGMWADEEGGVPKPELPKEVEAAMSAIAKAEGLANEPEQTPLLDAVLICLHRSTRSQDGRRVCCQCGVDRGPRDPDEWGAGEVEEAEPLTDVQWHEKECA